MRLLNAVLARDEDAAQAHCREILNVERLRVRHYAKAGRPPAREGWGVDGKVLSSFLPLCPAGMVMC